jgi:hypothetical protein
MANDDLISPMAPPLTDDIVLTTHDSDAVEQGLNNAFAELDRLAITTATPEVLVVDTTPTVETQTSSFPSSSTVETGVVSLTVEPQYQPAETEEEPTPTPIGLSTAGQINWKKLDQAKRELKKELKAVQQRELFKDQQIRQLQHQLQSVSTNAQIPEQVVQELNALREFRDIWGIEHHSDFVKKYDGAIAEYGNRIAKVLVSRGMPMSEAEAAELVRDTKTSAPISVEVLAKSGFENVDVAFWDTSIFPHISSLERRQIEDSLIGILNTKEARDKAVVEAVQKRNAYLQKAEEIKRAELAAEEKLVYSELEDYYKIAPWARRATIFGNESPGRRAALEAHNRKVDEYEILFAAAYRPQNIKQRVQVAAMAVLCNRQIMEISALREALELTKQEALKWKNKVEGIKSATSVRQSTVNVVKETPKGSVEDLLKMGDSAAIEYAMKLAGV